MSLRIARRAMPVARQTVVGERVPRRYFRDERVIARPDPRVVIERSEPDPDLFVVERIPAEQRRSAFAAEQLRDPGRRLIGVQLFAAAQQSKSGARDAEVGG